jgi:hypothetical protein
MEQKGTGEDNYLLAYQATYSCITLPEDLLSRPQKSTTGPCVKPYELNALPLKHFVKLKFTTFSVAKAQRGSRGISILFL